VPVFEFSNVPVGATCLAPFDDQDGQINEKVLPIHGSFGRRYYPHVLGAQYLDLSFVVKKEDVSIAFVNCGVAGGKISCYGFPLEIRMLEGPAPLSTGGMKSLLNQIFDNLGNLAAGHGSSEISIWDPKSGSSLSEVGEVCFARRGSPGQQFRGVVDLNLKDDEIRRSTRKSYRSLLNWGQRNLDIRYVNAERQDAEMFEAYRLFHQKVAGKVTRSIESWNAMYDFIAEGKGELVLGFLDGDQLVSGVLAVDSADVSMYASGVYDRDLFDKPLAHWPLFHAILRSRDRGMKFFDLGDLPTYDSVSSKEFNIGFFKRGFATCVDKYLHWTVPA
jgi:hypothetical protein